MDFFFELHKDLPREGPGDNESTRRALAMIPDLPAAPRILDIGCGPGMQTIELARVTGGLVTAVDTHAPFLEQLWLSARQARLDEKVIPVNASMFSLDFPPESFDLLWSEGAVYIMGFEQGLRDWRRLLKSGGGLAVTEISWLRDDPPKEVFDFWHNDYPGMRGTQANLEIIRGCGYRVLGHFTLPESSWWEAYYNPIKTRIAGVRQRYAGNDEALQAIQLTEQEMDLYARFSDWYGYVFYVMQKV